MTRNSGFCTKNIHYAQPRILRSNFKSMVSRPRSGDQGLRDLILALIYLQLHLQLLLNNLWLSIWWRISWSLRAQTGRDRAPLVPLCRKACIMPRLRKWPERWILRSIFKIPIWAGEGNTTLKLKNYSWRGLVLWNMWRAQSDSCSVIGAKASVKADQKISLIENDT